MTDIIHLVGWLEWEDTSFGFNTLFYKEYENFDPALISSEKSHGTDSRDSRMLFRSILLL